MTLGKLTLFCWVWFGLMSIGFLPLCLLASEVPGPGWVHIVLYVFVIGVLWWGSFGYGMYLAQAGMGNGDRHVLKRGIRGTATILEAKGTNTYIGGSSNYAYAGRRVYRYKLRVELPGRRAYETYCSVASHGLNQGDQVQVAAAKHNRKRVAIDLGQAATKGYAPSEAPKASRERERERQQERERARERQQAREGARHQQELLSQARAQRQQELHDRSSTPHDAVPAQPRHGDESERLRQLAEVGRLHKEGVLSDEEFAAEKARILGFSS